VPAVFTESSAHPRLLETLARETGARLAGTLFADGLGETGSGAYTYEGMIRHNIRTLVDALAAK
jgi:ABC-type Zn uptake system ZnuABC Zn-binding protein ZnuA